MGSFPSERSNPGRSSPRYPCRFTVELVCGGVEQQAETYDVGMSGAYIATPEPLPLNQLVNVTVHAPGLAKPVRWMGRVVRVVSNTAASSIQPPGVAMQVFGIDDVNRALWIDALSIAYHQCHGLDAEQAARDPSGAQVQVPPPRLAYDVPLEITVRDMRSLLRLIARDISAGGAFVPTGEHLAVGAVVEIHIRHPVSNQTFALDARIVRAAPGGVGVEFVGLDPDRRKELQRFIITGREL
jgi:hypothetical protein